MPIACSLPEEQERDRREELSRDLFSAVLEARELEDGYEYAFPGDAATTDALLRFVREERECCRFLSFELVFEPDKGPIRLRVRGPEGTKEFLARAPGGSG